MTETIYSYTRAEAIEDGILVDLTPLMKAHNMMTFKYPVACTSAVWEAVINWDEYDGTQSIAGRLWDVLNQALHAIKINHDPSADVVHFDVMTYEADATTTKDHELKIHIGPGDKGEPVMTIMFEGED